MRILFLILMLYPMTLWAQNVKSHNDLQRLVTSIRKSENQTQHINDAIATMTADITDIEKQISDYSFIAAQQYHAILSLKKSPEKLAFLSSSKSYSDFYKRHRLYENQKQVLLNSLQKWQVSLDSLTDKKQSLEILLQDREELKLTVNSLLTQIKNHQSSKDDDSIDARINTLKNKHDSLQSMLSELITIPDMAYKPKTQPVFRLPVSGSIAMSDEAMTIKAANGALVTTPASGKVIYAAPFKSLGEVMIIDHGYGYISLIWGIKNLLAEGGYILNSGDPIGIIGGDDWTKRGNRPILSYQLRYNGDLINPMTLMTGL